VTPYALAMPAAYDAPLAQIRTAIDQAAASTGLLDVASLAESVGDVADSILENAARFAREVLSPLNPIGDRTPSRCTPEGVITPPGFVAAYDRFRSDGWTALNVPAKHGGMGLPTLVSAATGEMWAGANMSFAMCAELAAGAVEALISYAPPNVRDEYLPHIVSGEWTTAMALTEPQAGSDLSTVRTRAEPEGETWRLFGRKLYISWGDHDLSDNIVHLVLARAPDAPVGLRGISLFLVPKRWPSGGALVPNDIRAISVEHKMGIRASPTCAMVLGEHDGARGWLIGTRDEGLACMFTMMNHMRIGVGVHSLGCAQRALQLARIHAHDRVQGRNAQGAQRPIIEHADVRRMLLMMKSLTASARHLLYLAAATLDVAHATSDAAAVSRLGLLTPIVKAWISEIAVEVTSLGVQIHGGTGYVDDSEISQLYRDARIGPIFEGTNYIQAQDLLSRKVLRDSGKALASILEDAQRAAEDVPADHAALVALRTGVIEHCARLRRTADQLQRDAARDPELIGSVAHHFLQWLGVFIGGWQQCVAASRALSRADEATLDVAAFYGAHILPRGLMHEAVIAHGSAPVSGATLASI
jgi:alkylation response protein AidB-like acyl-CoA dehydrogenase